MSAPRPLPDEQVNPLVTGCLFIACFWVVVAASMLALMSWGWLP